MANKAHHADPLFRKAGAAIRARANANPNTRCWRCERTMADIRKDHPNATWDAGHIIDGTLAGGLAAECSRCNRSHGAAMGNAQREPTSRRW